MMSARISFASLRDDFSDQLKKGPVEKPLYVICWRCHKDTSSDMRWSCPHCDFGNHRTQLYSFLNKCQKCERAPNGVVCPHCDAVISDERGERCVAREYVPKKAPLPPVLKEDPEVREQREHETKKRRLKREKEIADLEADLVEAKNRAKPGVEETDEQRKDKEAAAYVSRIMGYHKSIQKAQLQAQKDYKDDPDALEKVNMALEQFRESKMQS